MLGYKLIASENEAKKKKRHTRSVYTVIERLQFLCAAQLID